MIYLMFSFPPEFDSGTIMSPPNQALAKRISFSLLCVLLLQLVLWALTLGKHTLFNPITSHHAHMPRSEQHSHNGAFQVVCSSKGRSKAYLINIVHDKVACF